MPPLVMLVRWPIFALAAGVKFWRLTSLFLTKIQGTPSGTQWVRQSLDRG
jgi:hypothetical protein